jgi:hypothetical protein
MREVLPVSLLERAKQRRAFAIWPYLTTRELAWRISDFFKDGKLAYPRWYAFAVVRAPVAILPPVMLALPESLKTAREYALLGNYETALVYFEQVFSQIDQYVECRSHGLQYLHMASVRFCSGASDASLISKWQRTKSELMAEQQLIKEIGSELAQFRVCVTIHCRRWFRDM